LDFYLGLIFGKLKNQYYKGAGYFPTSEIFEDIPRYENYINGKMGMSIGYMF